MKTPTDWESKKKKIQILASGTPLWHMERSMALQACCAYLRLLSYDLTITFRGNVYPTVTSYLSCNAKEQNKITRGLTEMRT